MTPPPPARHFAPIWLPRRPRFIMPAAVESQHPYMDGYDTYTAYNYRSAGPVVGWIKRRHFEIALELTRNSFHRDRVIDMACGDGPFLPSLSRWFPRVLAIDHNPQFIDIARRVVSKMNLANVRLLCNASMPFDELARTAAADGPCRLMFLLEALEHIGEPARMYESKMQFLHQAFRLLAPGGRIVISVPKMVGPSFLVQRLGMWAARMKREPLAPRQLLKLGLLCDPTDLEPTWHTYSHLGFSHQKLTRHLRRCFHMLAEWDDLFQVVYVIAQRR